MIFIYLIQYAPVNIEGTNSGNGEIQEKPSIIGIMWFQIEKFDFLKVKVYN